ncbi:MAG: MOSC domain-containing protein [Pseudomonadota bacterium]
MQATVVSLFYSAADGSGDVQPDRIEVALDGIVGDAHRSQQRAAWEGDDKQPEGTERRNERQWSATSVEELEQISSDMGLAETLSASDIRCNLCLSGIDQLSRLPKGTILKFPSGAELAVEEYNPPCLWMGTEIAKSHQTVNGEAPMNTAFSKAAKLSRGIVGVVEVAGAICVGDVVEVSLYETPAWLIRSAD